MNDISAEIDAMFAKIQRYLLECGELDSNKKDVAIQLCMSCNDQIIKLIR